MSIKKINDNFAISGVLSADDIKLVASQGYKSILNVRASDESGFVQNEQSVSESLGLKYAHSPLPVPALPKENSLAASALIDTLPKPVLVHCAGSNRAAVVLFLNMTKGSANQQEEIQKLCKENTVNLPQGLQDLVARCTTN